ncbi:hypothetical protein ES708_15202 [subsurface metagenome]
MNHLEYIPGRVLRCLIHGSNACMPLCASPSSGVRANRSLASPAPFRPRALLQMYILRRGPTTALCRPLLLCARLCIYPHPPSEKQGEVERVPLCMGSNLCMDVSYTLCTPVSYKRQRVLRSPQESQCGRLSWRMPSPCYDIRPRVCGREVQPFCRKGPIEHSPQPKRAFR